jgi:hypothetical protein
MLILLELPFNSTYPHILTFPLNQQLLANIIKISLAKIFGNAANKFGPLRVARWFISRPKISTYLGIFWSALELKMLVRFMAIWYNLWPFGIMYSRLV